MNISVSNICHNIMKRSDISYQQFGISGSFDEDWTDEWCENDTLLSCKEMNVGMLFWNSVSSSGTLTIWSETEWKKGWRWAWISLSLWRESFPCFKHLCFPSGEEYRRERKRDFRRPTVPERPVCRGVSWGSVGDFWCQSERVSIRSGPLDGLLHVLLPLPRQNLLVSVCVRHPL